MNAVDWSINWWKSRHDNVYFPVMDQHKDWCVYGEPPPRLVPLLNSNKSDSVLEIGCGYGQWMVPVSRLVKSVMGVDIHPILEQKARETFAAHNIKNCRYVMGDGKRLPFLMNVFDVVYSISVFQHIPRAIVVMYLYEAKRVLKESGRYLFHFRNADGVGDYSEDITVDHTGDFSVGWTREQIESAAIAARFTDAEVTEDGPSIYLHSKIKV